MRHFMAESAEQCFAQSGGTYTLTADCYYSLNRRRLSLSGMIRKTEEDFSYKVAGTGARPWTLRINCHDILQQLSNTRQVINSQSITETWYNSVPAYVMLHLYCRFSKQPKK